ncbi:unnamed protein product [Meloidogyne enterolobii]|uniref:Uncharacterized protein n=1 Tax=Meloidogyne enterolobii TaxID=390850 RepID=A0ACB1A036_MELEN
MIENGTVTQEELENKVESLEEENRQLREGTYLSLSLSKYLNILLKEELGIIHTAKKCSRDSALIRAIEAINDLVGEIGRAVGRGIRAVFDVIGRAIKGIGNVIARALTAIGNVISSCLKAIGNLLSRFFRWIGSWFS